jgi:acyl-CoA synthetase (AMP-forming)/AMP-acid ligase II
VAPKFGAIVAGQARRVPQRVAVACGAERLTFGQLDARSDRLAQALLARGLRAGDRVVLYLGNGLPFIELFLATVKAGGIVVPVTTRLTAPELRYIVDDTQPFAMAFEPSGRAAAATARQAAPAALAIVAGADAAPGEVRQDDLAHAGRAEAPPPLPETPDDLLILYSRAPPARPRAPSSRTRTSSARRP